MKHSIKIFAARSLACAVGAAMLFNTAQVMADDVDAGDTYNQTTPIGGTQRDHNIAQPNAFGGDTSQHDVHTEKETSASTRRSANDNSQRDADIASDKITQTGEPTQRGALVNTADGSRQIQISNGENQIQPVMADTLLELKLVNKQNIEIGEVEEVVQVNNGRAALVVEAGGFLGIGEKEVLVPLDEVRLSGNQLIWESDMTASQLKDSTEYRYEEDRYSSIADD